MSNRTQQVRIGDSISSPLTLEAGLPQGGILSPIIFTIYGADLEEWLNHSKAFTYADDSETSSNGKTRDIVISKMMEDANGVLDFMASNGLVANASKTVFMMLNDKEKFNPQNFIEVGGNMIPQSEETKLLGMQVHDSQKWNSHMELTIKSLNMRLFQIRRIVNHIPRKHIMKVVHSLWFSKVRYGIQLWATTRTKTRTKLIQ